MRSTILLPCALISAAAVLGAPGARAGELPIDVMTFNIRFGTAYDRENNWPNRQDMVVRMLRQYDADIVGTQETLDFQADFIQHWIPEYRWFGPERTTEGLAERCAILHKWREFIAVETGTFWLSETPEVFASQSWDAALPRIATWARFHHPATGADFHFYNTHFDHVGREARVESMRIILEDIEQRVGDGPVIFVGDFNVTAERDPVYDMPIEAGFIDAWTASPERVGSVATWGMFRAPLEDSDRRIDWILFRGPFEVDYVETINYNEDGRFPSDHYPVFARLRMQLQD